MIKRACCPQWTEDIEESGENEEHNTPMHNIYNCNILIVEEIRKHLLFVKQAPSECEIFNCWDKYSVYVRKLIQHFGRIYVFIQYDCMYSMPISTCNLIFYEDIATKPEDIPLTLKTT